MPREVVVETRRESIAQRSHARIEARVFRLSQPWNFECVIESIFFEHLLAVQLGRTTQSENEVFLDTPEVILRLSVSEAEHSAGVSATEDMRHAVSVAIDRDVASEGIRLREEQSLKSQEDADGESKSSNHLADIKPQRGTKSTNVQEYKEIKLVTSVGQTVFIFFGDLQGG